MIFTVSSIQNGWMQRNLQKRASTWNDASLYMEEEALNLLQACFGSSESFASNFHLEFTGMNAAPAERNVFGALFLKTQLESIFRARKMEHEAFPVQVIAMRDFRREAC
jgi:hypothetical protein